jgi:hypothetical protein
MHLPERKKLSRISINKEVKSHHDKALNKLGLEENLSRIKIKRTLIKINKEVKSHQDKEELTYIKFTKVQSHKGND